jgi:hypothetical protein
MAEGLEKTAPYLTTVEAAVHLGHRTEESPWATSRRLVESLGRVH